MAMSLDSYIGLTEVGALGSYVRSVTKGHFRVKFDPDAPTAYVDGVNMVIPTPNSRMTLRDAIRLRGWAIHETSHPIYQPKAFDILRANPMGMNSPLRACYNMFLDVHAESCRAYDWPGDAKALSEFGAVTGRDVTDNFKKRLSEDGAEFTEDSIKVSAIMEASVRAESTWNTGLRLGFDELFNKLYPPEVAPIASDLFSKFRLAERLTDPSESEESLWNLSKDVFEYLFDMPAESQIEQPSKGKGKSEEEGEDGDGDETEGTSKGTKYGKDGEPGDGEPDNSKKIEVHELVWTDHYEKEDGSPAGMGFDYTNYEEHQVYTPWELSEVLVVDYERGGR